MIMLEVTKAEYMEEYRIQITFNNGASGVVDLKEALWGAMFEKLKDYNTVRKFEVSDVVHTIRWENDTNGVEYDFPSARATKVSRIKSIGKSGLSRAAPVKSANR